MKLSVVIPSYKDPFIHKTIDSLLNNSELGNDLEVIPVIDGDWLDTPIRDDSRVKPIYLEKNLGMRGAINEGLKVARGKFIMKVDSHCCFAPGLDAVLVRDCKKENWLLIPRRYSLKEEIFDRDRGRPLRDFHALHFPLKEEFGYTMSVQDWYKEGDKSRALEDTMIMQGSCWFANREYFMRHVGLLDDRPETYGTFAMEHVEIGLKYWLGGGEIKVDKNTWYAHLGKKKKHYDSGKYDREYKIDPVTLKANVWASRHWIRNEEPGMIHDFKWFIKKFMPVPSWPDNWEFLLSQIYD